MTMSAEGEEVGEDVSLSGSAVCPDEGRFPTLAELQVGLGSGGKKRICKNISSGFTSSFIVQGAQPFSPASFWC